MKDVTNYPTALHRILAEMEALTPEQIAATEVKDPVARSEKEIGEPLPEPLRALWALHKTKVDQFNSLVEQHNALHTEATEDAPLDKAEHGKLHGEIQVLGEETQVLERLFWRSVRDQYEADPDGNGIGVRAGWHVVDIYGGKRRGLVEMLFGGLFD